MSWNPSLDPVCPDVVAVEAIDTLIVPRARDIGGFEVRRALSALKRQMVQSLIFFDQMGPAAASSTFHLTTAANSRRCRRRGSEHID